jgi:aminoglycoside phosphotransferase (APT) family kinase protein
VSVPLVSMLGPGDRSALGASLDELERIWDFDRGEHWSGVVDDSLVLLRATMPSTDQGAVLLWGDARPANVIVAVDGFRPVGLLDWELATIGPAELDVTWLAEMNRMRMEGSGVAPLPGFLDDDAAAVHYERRSGRPLHDLGWYQLHSATRIAVLMHRHLRVMVHAGRLPADHRLLVETIATRRLAELAAAFA